MEGCLSSRHYSVPSYTQTTAPAGGTVRTGTGGSKGSREGGSRQATPSAAGDAGGFLPERPATPPQHYQPFKLQSLFESVFLSDTDAAW